MPSCGYLELLAVAILHPVFCPERVFKGLDVPRVSIACLLQLFLASYCPSIRHGKEEPANA